MGITYLVLAHHKPAQFARMLVALNHSGASFVVHIDAKADQALFVAAAREAGLDVQFVTDRRSVRWGNFEIVRAELALLRHATQHAASDYYVLLSGVDYPIRPNHELLAELTSGATYMNSWRMPSPERGKPMARLEYFWWAPVNRDNSLAHVVNHKLFPRLPKRNVARGLGGRQPFGGSQWWALPAPVAAAVLDFADREKRFSRFFERSHIPDEMFFQTIVGALEQPVDLRPGLTFADWSRPEGGGGSPAILSGDDVAQLRSVRHFFARKFDLDRYPDSFDVLDRELLAS